MMKSKRKKLIREHEIKFKRAMRMAKKYKRVSSLVLQMLDDLKIVFGGPDFPSDAEVSLVFGEYKKLFVDFNKRNCITKEQLVQTQKFIHDLEDPSISFSSLKTSLHDYALSCRKEASAFESEAGSAKKYVSYLLKANCR